ncbi:DUF1129 domain-containing protein [Atopococcus tabaci]|uniref:DUF1129 domain-containing protein n=1 Tax=Atopococcus tabaci TaxID=269774 RepID=UPI00240A5753|nr:DUF1129 family protein [Atopococcus tabaci]
MEPENNQHDTVDVLQQKQAENKELFDRLTNKNRDYMVKLNRRLEDADMPAEQRTEIFNDMLKTLVEQQGLGITARQLYGTVPDQARSILESPTQTEEGTVERSESWKLYLDGALLLGGMFALISGLSYLFGNENPENQMGLITLIFNFLVGGAVVLAITKNAPVPGRKGGMLRYILVSIVAMLAWILLMTFATVIIPPSINIPLPGWLTLLIGAAAFAAKFYFKRKLNIKGTLM